MFISCINCDDKEGVFDNLQFVNNPIERFVVKFSTTYKSVKFWLGTHSRGLFYVSIGSSIYCCQLKVGEFANARSAKFASVPSQVTIEKLGPGQGGCKDAVLAKAKLQL